VLPRVRHRFGEGFAPRLHPKPNDQGAPKPVSIVNDQPLKARRLTLRYGLVRSRHHEPLDHHATRNLSPNITGSTGDGHTPRKQFPRAPRHIARSDAISPRS
jgi:hypothetical protein